MPYTEPERMATFINLVLSLDKKKRDSNRPNRMTTIDAPQALMASRHRISFFE
ncbi:hypothetical protein ALQ97_200147 [Pseudomonas savastanoi pv. glycinea]|nr:hypothetical protein ALQ97_200147 [Pseudomonas savastanoi pv. glycinea]